jgi:hypothetical protein
MDAHAIPSHRGVRASAHSHRALDDCFGDFLLRVVCDCGACREIQPAGTRAPRRLESDAQGAGVTDALRAKAAEVVAVASRGREGLPKSPHRERACSPGTLVRFGS